MLYGWTRKPVTHAIDKELKQINDYKTFRRLRDDEIIEEYTKIH